MIKNKINVELDFLHLPVAHIKFMNLMMQYAHSLHRTVDGHFVYVKSKNNVCFLLLQHSLLSAFQYLVVGHLILWSLGDDVEWW